MTRIIAGRWGGRRLRTPAGESTRPTADRVRESLFSSLESVLGGFEGCVVLDLFAGSGGLGLEALSRGARRCDFVESNARAATVVRANVAALGASGGAVRRMRAEKFVEGDHGPYDLIFADPPYEMSAEALAAILQRIRLAEDAIVVVERSSRDAWSWPTGIIPVREKRHGETTVWYGRGHDGDGSA